MKPKRLLRAILPDVLIDNFDICLLYTSKELKEAGKYKNALSQLAKARDLGVAEDGSYADLL